jgi:hypothetical protein
MGRKREIKVTVTGKKDGRTGKTLDPFQQTVHIADPDDLKTYDTPTRVDLAPKRVSAQEAAEALNAKLYASLQRERSEAEEKQAEAVAKEARLNELGDATARVVKLTNTWQERYGANVRPFANTFGTNLSEQEAWRFIRNESLSPELTSPAKTEGVVHKFLAAKVSDASDLMTEASTTAVVENGADIPVTPEEIADEVASRARLIHATLEALADEAEGRVLRDDITPNAEYNKRPFFEEGYEGASSREHDQARAQSVRRRATAYLPENTGPLQHPLNIISWEQQERRDNYLQKVALRNVLIAVAERETTTGLFGPRTTEVGKKAAALAGWIDKEARQQRDRAVGDKLSSISLR